MIKVAELKSDWENRLTELSQLNGSWNEGYIAVTPTTVNLTREILQYLSEMNLPVGIFPTVTGGVQLEWNLTGDRYAITVDRAGRIETSRSRLFNGFVREIDRPLTLTDTTAILDTWSLRTL